MGISEADFNYVREFVYQKAAIVLEDSKAYLVESRLQPLAKKEGFASLGELIEQLRAQRTNGLHWNVIEAMTTNETYFFRDIHPFELLRQHVLPELIKKRFQERKLHIWCAAASSGQEPYSILMILREHFPELASWHINLVASDISRQMLERCGEGRYSQLEVNRGLPASLLIKYFQKIGTEWRIKDELRSMIHRLQMNLAEPWPALPPMDVIFIRNVLIYFDHETKKQILGWLRKILKPDGYLFLGGAETTLNIDESFKRAQIDKGAYYQIAT
jgi:chemotaxis protein methyltransferase CheR